MSVVPGGRATYGQVLGIMVLDTQFPRLPGDIGNATTFNFPVRFSVVRGASPERVVVEQDPKLLGPFIEAAKELEASGVRAITTTCGFLTIFQKQLAAEVNIPVFTSSLLQVPIVHRMLRPDQKVGILTANGETLSEQVLEAVGASTVPHAVIGSEHTPAVYDVFVKNGLEIDPIAAEEGVVAMARDLVERHPDIGAFVSEDINFSPFGQAVQQATGRPFFDIVTMTEWVFRAVVKQRVHNGFM